MNTALLERGAAMRRARRRFDRAAGGPDVRAGELLRHPVYTRIVHWSVATFFILALLSGFAIYSPVALSLADPVVRRRTDDAAAAPVVQHRVRGVLRRCSSCTGCGRCRGRATTPLDAAHEAVMSPTPTRLEPEYVDFFNAGQKLYFWAIGATARLSFW